MEEGLFRIGTAEQRRAALYSIGAVSQNSFRMHFFDAVLSYNFKVQAKPVFPSFSSTENPYNNFLYPEERSQARTS